MNPTGPRVLAGRTNRSNTSKHIRTMSHLSFYILPPSAAADAAARASSGATPRPGPTACHTPCAPAATCSGTAGLSGDTLCHYLLTRFCVLCSEEPARPASYSPIDAITLP